jgi:tetratricopeptide (TPR) repeat protein
MTKEQKDNLFVLIKSLSKSEKRQFKLYVGRLGVNEDSKFLLLFNVLQKLKVYDEAAVLKNGFVKKQQLSNLKAHLYKQILISLRLNPSHQDIRIQIREQLDFATILYHKGLYTQSLKILDKAKSLAIVNEEKNIANEIVELEKVIEAQYITRSISNRADELTVQAKALNQQNVLASKLSNLSLQLYGLFLKTGYVKAASEHEKVTTYFNDRLPVYKISELGFREKLWLYKSYLWYSFLTQDFLACYKYSKKWVDLFHDNQAMIKLNPVFFLNGNQYLLEALFFIKQHDKFKKTLSNLIAITTEDWFPKDDNVESLTFLFVGSNKFNSHFMEGTFKEGLPLVSETLEGLRKHKSRIDEHHVMVFYYKIASLYFGIGEYDKCISYLNKIITNKSLQMREDLLCFSRILNLVAHYEAGLDYNLESLIKSTYRFLIKMEDLYLVQKEMIKFLKLLGDIYPQDIKMAFKQLHAKLKVFENDPYEKRAFLYLDVLSWLESKIENKSVESIIRRKFLSLNKNN